jgi:hypothetical protein
MLLSPRQPKQQSPNQRNQEFILPVIYRQQIMNNCELPLSIKDTKYRIFKLKSVQYKKSGE